MFVPVQVNTELLTDFLNNLKIHFLVLENSQM